MKLSGKTVFAFGDSIVYGHSAPELSFMRLIKRDEAIRLYMYAVNGATVIARTDKNIIDQIKNADAEEKPDFIVFDGYTNDAYKGVEAVMGALLEDGSENFDNQTFYGAFEEIVCTMKKRWPDAKIVFVTIHKSAARDWEIQKLLREASLEVCKKWGVFVLDMFENCSLDTRDSLQMEKYIMGGAGSHPNLSACEQFYAPMVKNLLETL